MSIKKYLLSPQSRFAAIVVGALISLAMLTWLYRNAELINPAQHWSYLQSLRDFGEANAHVDAEVLASNFKLTNNYDSLTANYQLLRTHTKKLAQAPDFLPLADQQRIENSTQILATAVAEKIKKIEKFKRLNTVLQSALHYFPLASSRLLDSQEFKQQASDSHLLFDQYVRNVLAYSRTPSAEIRKQIEQQQQALTAASFTPKLRLAIDNLMLDGELISSRMEEFNSLVREIIAQLNSGQLETLSDNYHSAYQNAQLLAARYRLAMNSFLLLLTAVLVWAAIRFSRRRRNPTTRAPDNHQHLAGTNILPHEAAFLRAHDAIALTDAQCNIIEVNPAFSRITGWQREEIVGQNMRFLKSGRHDAAFYEAMWDSIRRNGYWQGEIQNRNKFGDIYPELLAISSVTDEAGQVRNYVAVFSDISRLKAQEKQLAQMYYYDAQTNLPNRVLLSDRLRQARSQSERSHTSMAICVIDLDGFKAVNESLGMETGDQLLVEVAHRLKSNTRGGDTVARVGGDEFVVLLLGLTSAEECQQAVQNLLSLISQPLRHQSDVVNISASIGITLYPEDESSNESLLRHADQAMYLAKQSGRNRMHFFDAERDRQLRGRHGKIERIRQALNDGEFVLYYQPKVNMRQGEVIGAEALIRWIHPQNGLVPPGDFLPLIEDSELITQVGDWVIAKALEQMETWRQAGLQIVISVNVASRQLLAPDFVDKLKAALNRYPQVACYLELEVLESAALEDVSGAASVIKECHALGVGFALDDFGTGYSSLSYLRRLPAEVIKIDQSFVRDILSDPDNLVIVHAVSGLADSFQRRLIAEGVETAEHGRMLMQLDCDLAQGYGISKPMPAANLLDWVKQWRPDPLWQNISSLCWDEGNYRSLIAEVSHRDWVGRIVYAMNNNSRLPDINVSGFQQCKLCIWHLTENNTAKSSGAISEFVLIEEEHCHFHTLIAKISEFWRNQLHDEARALIPDLLASRDKILAAMYRYQLATAKQRSPLPAAHSTGTKPVSFDNKETDKTLNAAA